MKRLTQFVLAVCTVAFVAGCGCTTESHTVRIKETRTYTPAVKKKSSAAEDFEPVNRY